MNVKVVLTTSIRPGNTKIMMANSTGSLVVELDQLDLTLIEELEIDARQTSRDLGKKLGVSATTISARMRKMIDNGVIGFAAAIDPSAIGLQIETLWGLKITPGKSADVAEYFKDGRNVRNVGIYTGCYDVLLYTIFRDNDELFFWMTEQLGCVADVLTAEQILMIKVIKHSSKYLHAETNHPYQCEYPNLDEWDLKLIKELELAPRDTFDSLGKKAGMSRQLAARRLKKLLDAKVVRVFSVPDPMMLGYIVCVHVFIRARSDRVIPITSILAAHPQVKYVSIIGGTSNIMIYGAFLNVEEMSNFLMNELGRIPGVVGYETAIQAGRAHSSYRVMNWG